jgi:hypothetical protein
MVREGPTEPAAAPIRNTPLRAQARNYGMLFTALIATAASIAAAYIV